MPALQNHTDVFIDHQADHNQKNAIFNNQKNRFHLCKSIWVFLCDRFIQKRNQNQKRSEQNQIRYVKNAVHQDCVGMKYRGHDHLCDSEQKASHKREPENSLLRSFFILH